MAFDWGQYLKLAEFLKDKGEAGFNEEASARCAVGRAYYAAFCHARDVAQKNGLVLRRTGEDHTSVRDYYKARGMAVVANKLDTLRQWRADCDYRLDVGDMFTKKPAVLDLAIMHARYVLTTLRPTSK
jgi:hypothetical protein